ncbi:hypothetical protein ABKV19_011782 [Rosa sericea]
MKRSLSRSQQNLCDFVSLALSTFCWKDHASPPIHHPVSAGIRLRVFAGAPSSMLWEIRSASMAVV